MPRSGGGSRTAHVSLQTPGGPSPTSPCGSPASVADLQICLTSLAEPQPCLAHSWGGHSFEPTAAILPQALWSLGTAVWHGGQQWWTPAGA